MAKSIKYLLTYVLYLTVVWSAYRVSGISVPQEIDEFIIKPIVWLVPIFIILRKENKNIASVGITFKNLYPGLFLAVFLGFVFTLEAFLVNYIKYGSSNLSANIGDKIFIYSLFISLATAVSEEIAFRGFIFGRLWNYFKNEIFANLVTSIFWVMIHIPATFALLGYSFDYAISYWLLALVYSVGACFIYARTKNVFSSILLFVLWEASIILFR